LGTLYLYTALTTMKLGTLSHGHIVSLYSISNLEISLLATRCSGEDIHNAGQPTEDFFAQQNYFFYFSQIFYDISCE
jgi:hypothetical protein